jgi:hypothetical protein
MSATAAMQINWLPRVQPYSLRLTARSLAPGTQPIIVVEEADFLTTPGPETHYTFGTHQQVLQPVHINS